MRYQVRFSNGYYKLFDTVEFADVDLFFSRAEAEKAAEAANRGRRRA